ncbi:hypothetical protein AAZX31_07G160800 [Glycine max]
MLFSFSFHSYVYQIRNSVKLKRIMQTILSLGNVFNHGTIRGELNFIGNSTNVSLIALRLIYMTFVGLTVGFRLDSLLKLTDTRATNNNMTLMHYLCKVNQLVSLNFNINCFCTRS